MQYMHSNVHSVYRRRNTSKNVITSSKEVMLSSQFVSLSVSEVNRIAKKWLNFREIFVGISE